MRKSLFLLSIIAVSVFMTSCQGRDGRDGRDVSYQIVQITVPQRSWNYSWQGIDNYFYASIDMPEITEAVFDGGIIKMYRTFDYETMDAYQIEMPYIRPHEYEYTENQWGFYTETVDYDFGIGNMYIYYRVSDFDYELDESFVPEAMTFRCVIAY